MTPAPIVTPWASGLPYYIGTDIPTAQTFPQLQVGAFWSDLTAARWKRCTSVAPVTFVVEGADAFPVGAVFLSVVATNPATLLGYGTWVSIGAGRVLVGIDSTDVDFDTVEKTGGAKTHTHTGHTAHIFTQPVAHVFTQPSTHSAHVVTQPSAHSAHVVTQPAAHIFTQPSAHSAHIVTQPSAHVVTQPGAHSAHAVTQPATHSALATHQHTTPVTGDGVTVHYLPNAAPFGTSATITSNKQLTTTAGDDAGRVGWLTEAISGGTPSAHSGTAVDAHSAHSGTAVDAHSGTAVDAHSAHAGGAVDAHSGTAVDAHSVHSGTAVDAHSAHAGGAVDAHTGGAVDAHSAHNTPSHVMPYLVVYIWKRTA